VTALVVSGYVRPDSEPPAEYAQRRANETGKPYMVTTIGHAVWACAENIRNFRDMGCPAVQMFYPRAVTS